MSKRDTDVDDADETALSDSSSSSSSNSTRSAHGNDGTNGKSTTTGKARGRRKRAQTYSFKPLPTPLFLRNVPGSATVTLVDSNARTRGASFTARPALPDGDGDAPTETCELCQSATVCCKITMKLSNDGADGDSSKKSKSVSKLLCRRCALQQQEYAETIRIVHDDDNRLSFLTAARKWSDLALEQQKQTTATANN